MWLGMFMTEWSGWNLEWQLLIKGSHLGLSLYSTYMYMYIVYSPYIMWLWQCGVCRTHDINKVIFGKRSHHSYYFSFLYLPISTWLLLILLWLNLLFIALHFIALLISSLRRTTFNYLLTYSLTHFITFYQVSLKDH